MTFNPERGGERQSTPETGSDVEKWQYAGPGAREALLLEESDNWPPVEGKRRASPRAKETARTSSMLAVEAARVRRER